MPIPWIWAGIATAVVLFLLLLLLVLRRKRRERDGGVREALRAVAVDTLEDVLIPDGMGGLIHLEYALLTSRGILVVNVKPYKGIVFASDQMNEWTIMRDGMRSTLANPVGGLFDRVAAVKQIVRDVDVHGLVLFPEGADFSKGQPRSVALPAELLAGFPLPADGDRKRVAVSFRPYWEQLREAVETAPAASA